MGKVLYENKCLSYYNYDNESIEIVRVRSHLLAIGAFRRLILYMYLEYQ